MLGRAGPVGWMALAYGAAGIAAATLAAACGLDPFACAGWLGMDGAEGAVISLGAGICVGAVTIAVSRALVSRAAWGRALHAALRPAVTGAADGALLFVALASALGEELLFRGLLCQVIGVVASSALFGALHQVRGPARWGWALWAGVMGAVFGVMFVATGSLVGPVVAHLAINAANLRFLRDTDPAPAARRLGGLLGRT